MRSPIRPLFCHALIFAVLFLIPSLRADVTASLPLEGYYHPGRFIPVRIVCKSPPPILQLSADGAVPTTIENPHEGETIIPFLPVSGSIHALQIPGAPSIELKPVTDYQRLIAFADADANSAQAIFPSDTLFPIALELTRPLFDPPLAWTGLDAAVLSPAARARLSDAQISTLLSAGVALIVNDAQPPDLHWPWQHLGNLWVLRHNVAGPQDAVRAEAYTPTYAWDRGLPASTRRQIVLVAVIFSILAIGLSLWRFRYSTLAFLLVCAVTIALVWLVYLRRPTELVMAKTIAVHDSKFTQFDHWTWRATLRESHFTQPVLQYTVPVFASFRQIDTSELHLSCDYQGHPLSYDFRLAPDQSLAFVSRDILGSIPTPGSYGPVESRWRDFAIDLYMTQADQLAGEAQITPDISATIIKRTGGSEKSD